MAGAHVQSRSATGNGVANIGLAFTSGVTAGSLLVIGGSCWDRTFGTGSCTDDRSQTYTRDAVATAAAAPNAAIYSSPNAAAGATTVTLTATGTTDDISIAIHEYSGMVTVSPFDVGTSATGSGATHSPGTTGTTAQADELVLVMGTAGTSTGAPTSYADEGYSLRQNINTAADMPVASFDKFVAATGTQTISYGWDNDSWASCIGTYKVASGATLEQEGYRHRNDDGTEGTATWAAAQDSAASAAIETVMRTRVVLNATLDPAAFQPQVEWRKVGDATWNRLETS